MTSQAPIPSNPHDAALNPAPDSAEAALVGELQLLIVSALNLQDVPATVDPETPLYGEGLGLDSIDILEVALVVSKRYGLQLRADDENNKAIFHCLGSLAKHIARHRTK
jgi:acyl carrier protein